MFYLFCVGFRAKIDPKRRRRRCNIDGQILKCLSAAASVRSIALKEGPSHAPLCPQHHYNWFQFIQRIKHYSCGWGKAKEEAPSLFCCRLDSEVISLVQEGPRAKVHYAGFATYIVFIFYRILTVECIDLLLSDRTALHQNSNLNLWIYESMNPWIYESMNPWIYESMNFVWESHNNEYHVFNYT